jgi:hypothetical protein
MSLSIVRRPRGRLFLVCGALVIIQLATGCVSRDYVRSLGRSAAQGALEGMGDGIPSVREPLRATLRQALVDDDTLRRAAKGMSEAAVEGLEARLASPELRRQVDALVDQAMEAMARSGNEATRQLVRVAGAELKETLTEVATESIASATSRLREGVERDVTPAAQLLARRTAEQLVTALVAGLQAIGGEMGRAVIAGAARGMGDPENQASAGGFVRLVGLQAVRGAAEAVHEGLPDRMQAALIAGIVVLGAFLVLAAGGLTMIWSRYQKSTKSLAIVAESINQHEADALKATIKQSAHDNYVGPWLSSFLKRRGL